jgi:predicted NUDIX family NTP pyrophosphohydrolase
VGTASRHPRRSAGLLVYRRGPAGVEVLVGHMGGPFWARKDEHAWSLPKGEHGPEEDPRSAAAREFTEETAMPVPPGDWVDLGTVRQSSGKEVTAWAVEGDLDATAAVSNTVELEWPRGSGRRMEFPEMDRFAWVDLDSARRLLVSAQAAFADRLAEHLTPAG